MNRSYTQALYKSFPDIFPKPLQWGFEFDDGWYHLVFRLCTEIQAYAQQASIPIPSCVQAKEKFGTLKFYTPTANNEILAIVNKYEKESAITCEMTGNTGKLHRSENIVKTLCPEAAILLGYTVCESA